MVAHLVCVENFDDEERTSDHNSNGHVGCAVHDASMRRSGGVQPQKIGIVRDQNSTLRTSVREQRYVCHAKDFCFGCPRDIHAACVQPFRDGTWHVLIGEVLNSRHAAS